MEDIHILNKHIEDHHKPLPEWIKVPSKEFLAIGSAHSIFNQQRILSGLETFTSEDVEQTINYCVGLDD
jgi:hypothetical protein